MVRSLISILVAITLFSLVFVEVRARTPFDVILEELMKIIFFNKGKLGIGIETPAKKLDVAGGIKTDELCIGGKCFTAVCKTGGGYLLSESADCPALPQTKSEAPVSTPKLTIKATGPVGAATGRPRITNDDTLALTLSASGQLAVRALIFELSGVVLAAGAKFPVILINQADNTLWSKSEPATCLPSNGRCRIVFEPNASMKDGQVVKLKITVDSTLFGNGIGVPDKFSVRIVNDYDVVLKPGSLAGSLKFPLDLGEISYE